MQRRTFNKLAGFAGIGALTGSGNSFFGSDRLLAEQGKKHNRNVWDRYFLGTAYYPEWWEPSEWEIDFRQMRELGINTVRMGEFAWALYEPEPGKFQFDWMDRAIAVARNVARIPLAKSAMKPNAERSEFLKLMRVRLAPARKSFVRP